MQSQLKNLWGNFVLNANELIQLRGKIKTPSSIQLTCPEGKFQAFWLSSTTSNLTFEKAYQKVLALLRFCLLKYCYSWSQSSGKRKQSVSSFWHDNLSFPRYINLISGLIQRPENKRSFWGIIYIFQQVNLRVLTFWLTCIRKFRLIKF